MHRFIDVLSRNPEIGMISSIFSLGLSFTDITLILKLSGMGIGVLIGLLTLYIKIIEATKVTKELKEITKTKPKKRKYATR